MDRMKDLFIFILPYSLPTTAKVRVNYLQYILHIHRHLHRNQHHHKQQQQQQQQQKKQLHILLNERVHIMSFSIVLKFISQ
jgi:hypothetical protein